MKIEGCVEPNCAQEMEVAGFWSGSRLPKRDVQVVLHDGNHGSMTVYQMTAAEAREMALEMLHAADVADGKALEQPNAAA